MRCRICRSRSIAANFWHHRPHGQRQVDADPALERPAQKPTSGRILLGGEDIWAGPKEDSERKIPRGPRVPVSGIPAFEETVYRDIAFGPTNMGLSKDEIDRRVRESAHFAGLTVRSAEKSPFALSGGQKRRVAIAGVIAMEPEVLVLDEPSAGLDPQGRERAAFRASANSTRARHDRRAREPQHGGDREKRRPHRCPVGQPRCS
ncbi:MAG: ATP-binding cassette domain-containing protein [Oscillibacter sp.]